VLDVVRTAHRRRGRARGRGIVGEPVVEPIHDDIADEVDTDVMHDNVPVDVGQQTQGGAPRPTAYPRVRMSCLY
jgi:hypothetical protein